MPKDKPSSTPKTVAHVPGYDFRFNTLSYLNTIDSQTYKFLGPFNPQFIPLTVKKIMRKDGQLGLGLTVIKAPIIGDRYYVECRDERIAAWTQAWFDKLRVELLFKALNCLDFGFQAFEPIWTVQDLNYQINGEWHTRRNSVYYRKFNDLDPSWIKMRYDKKGRFTGLDVNQDDYAFAEKTVHLNLTQSFVCTFREEFGNLYGTSLLDNAYIFWYWCNQAYLMANRYLQNRGEPPMIGYAPQDSDVRVGEGEDARMLNALHYMGQVMAAVRGTGGGNLALPSEMYVDETGKLIGRKFDIKLLEDSSRGELFGTHIAHLQIMKLHSLLILPTAVDQGKGAPYGATEQHTATFLTTIDLIADMLLDCLNKYVIWKPAFYEFGENSPRPVLKRTGLSRDNRELLGNIIEKILMIERSKDFAGPEFSEAVDFIKTLERLNVPANYQKAQQIEVSKRIPTAVKEPANAV